MQIGLPLAKAFPSATFPLEFAEVTAMRPTLVFVRAHYVDGRLVLSSTARKAPPGMFTQETINRALDEALPELRATPSNGHRSIVCSTGSAGSARKSSH